MMSTYLNAVAAIYLVFASVWVSATGWNYLLAFKALPLILGALLGFTAYAQFMGWPV